MSTLTIKTPRWALPLQNYAPYKFIKGGRSSGKTHERGEAAIEAMLMNPDLKIVCIREIQKSLQFSGFQLIKDKIQSMGVSHYFDVVKGEIRRKGGNGIMIFQGMQDHTADSIKGLEGFKIAWCEEAQNLSKRSLDLLRPTIMRNPDFEMWFTWNPENIDDPIEKFHERYSAKGITVHVNYDQNPFLNKTTVDEIEEDKKALSPEDFAHIWLGEYNTRSDIRVFQNWRVDEIEYLDEWEPYHGADWGFAKDPTVLIRAWKKDKQIYIEKETHGVGIEIDHTPKLFDKIDNIKKYIIRADSARPETISYMKRQGYNVQGVKKGKGSVEDGVEWLRAHEIIVHPDCNLSQKELRLYSYKTNSAGDILPQVDDKAGYDHVIDALRYAFEPLIRMRKTNTIKASPASTGGTLGSYV